MNGTVIISNLYKSFNSNNSFRNFFNRKNEANTNISYILKNINIRIEPGEAIGIIGINGAGKSTLLKLITQITTPTSGEIFIDGRVTSLLELGIGLQLDSSGRENILLLSQLLGFLHSDIENILETVIEFSELGDHIDNPVKFYSTGMQMRLAFSIVTAIRPDILIIDEALSVGDAYFQQKSLERIKNFKELGTTIVFVSHDVQAILTICNKVLLLDNGEIIKQGNPESVIDYYNALNSVKNSTYISQVLNEDGKYTTNYGTKEVSISECYLTTKENKKSNIFEVNEILKINFLININSKINKLLFGFIIKDRVGCPVFGTNSEHLGMKFDASKFHTKIKFSFQFPANLGEGIYSISLGLSNSDLQKDFNYDWIDRIHTFEIINTKKNKFMGVAWLEVKCQVDD